MTDEYPDFMQSVYEGMPGPQDYSKSRQQQTKAEEFQRQCYEIFLVNPDGKVLLESLKEQFLIHAKVDMSKPNADHAAIYLEGMREVIRGLMEQALMHKRRTSGVNS